MTDNEPARPVRREPDERRAEPAAELPDTGLGDAPREEVPFHIPRD